MTETEKQWFAILTKGRERGADALEEPFLQGVQRSVVDKYSDQAHFIYELLQNADDAKATSTSFRLEQGGLYFHHNGSSHFTISDPTQEARDGREGCLGHVNSITSIAHSSKNEASIGKFGVGFKAVFQYTKTPHIYDPNIQFKIERFIVPILLEHDHADRKEGETVFYFPFDHSEKSPEASYDDIATKLKDLKFPVLFLSNLQTVSYQIDKTTGKYAKKVTKELELGEIQAQWIDFIFEHNQQKIIQKLLLSTRRHASNLRLSVVYAMSAAGRLDPMQQSAFCFFPTKETTNLRFLIHAPFLLTDSREGIKAGEAHNAEMIRQLAALAADSLDVLKGEKLIDDGIFDIVPYDASVFSDADDRSRISFKPFHEAFKNKFWSGDYLPAKDEKYAGRESAYWASDTELVELFSDAQLEQITGTVGARWVYRSQGRKEVLNAKKTALVEYIDGGDARSWIMKQPNLIVASLDPESLLRKIDQAFIAAQPMDWLHRFYAYLAERASYQKIVKTKPIFLDQEGNAVPAYDDKNELVLFLPDVDIEGYITVHKDLLLLKDTREFISNIGVKKPSLRHDIYNKILPAYEEDGEIDTTPHFAKFFRYYKECKNEEVESFIELIKDKEFITYSTVADRTTYRGMAKYIYMESPGLREWFEPKPATRFLVLDEYQEMVEEKDYKKLREFFIDLGVAIHPRVLESGDKQWRWSNISSNDIFIDGLSELLKNVDETKSLQLWKHLVEWWPYFGSYMTVTKNVYGPRGGFQGSSYYPSKSCTELRTERWLLNNKGELVTAEEITVQALSDDYSTESYTAQALIKTLEIHNESDDIAHLSAEEVRKIRLAEAIEKSGLTDEEVRQALDDAKRKKHQVEVVTEVEEKPYSKSLELTLIGDIQSRRNQNNTRSDSDHVGMSNTEQQAATDEPEDSDEYIPKTVNFGQKIERAKDRYAGELDQLEREQHLHEQAILHPRYSYGWFLAMLELECLTSEENSGGNHKVSIRFGKVERDPLSHRTIVLRQPNRFVPPSIEEYAGVRVDYELRSGSHGKIRIESFTAKEFSLYAKLETAEDLDELDLSAIVEARIEIQNPSFIQQELLHRLRELNLKEDYDLQKNLTPDIEFVFGPPGTGKTTHLAENIIIPRLRDEKIKVLILAPTNKAADVLTTRIIEKMGEDTCYRDWLIRFGTCADESIEAAGVWRDRSFDITQLESSVTITTIARLAYDGFSGPRAMKLRSMDWDLVIVDEASMIPLASIIYPLFFLKPWKFIIAGDPFQIQPIVSVDQWMDENIYTLVGLAKAGSFSNPVTIPHTYKVLNLDTQYRSVPSIGEVFSRFSYDGRLKHHRSTNSNKQLKLSGLEISPINLIKFPISKYESIYKARRLDNKTPYQTYSALFTFEMLKWMADQLDSCAGNLLRVGVIAPYRAQANILNRLVDSHSSMWNGMEIQVGTIHGFQGDECDIIFTVFNTPPNISSSSRMFLNKKNILNVAASRARDYLFIVLPDDDTLDRGNLRQLNRLEGIVKSVGDFSEFHSHEIENLIWGQENYLEENTHSTGHQMVNVYRKPEKRYEVRSDDSAVDVQIHEKESQNIQY